MEKNNKEKVVFPGMKEIDNLVKRIDKTLEETRKLRKRRQKQNQQKKAGK